MDQSCKTVPIPPPAPLLFYKNRLMVESTVSCVRYVSTRSSAIKIPHVITSRCCVLFVILGCTLNRELSGGFPTRFFHWSLLRENYEFPMSGTSISSGSLLKVYSFCTARPIESNSTFNKIPGWFTYTLKPEKHPSMIHIKFIWDNHFTSCKDVKAKENIVLG